MNFINGERDNMGCIDYAVNKKTKKMIELYKGNWNYLTGDKWGGYGKIDMENLEANIAKMMNEGNWENRGSHTPECPRIIEIANCIRLLGDDLVVDTDAGRGWDNDILDEFNLIGSIYDADKLLQGEKCS